MEGFFGLLKREMFYSQEHKYKDLNELEQAIQKYIDYYNNVRIKTRRKNMTPIEYRRPYNLMCKDEQFLKVNQNWV